MTCDQCTDKKHKREKTLYDKTIARRYDTASRMTKRVGAAGIILGVLALGSASSLTPAVASPDFSGFTTHAQATPLRIEVHEPAIPVPADPELELNFSYTKADGSSGPIGTARSSALWPGDAIGEGLKTFGEQLGLPSALLTLTNGGYPVQANAQTPGGDPSQTQQFLPGNTGTAAASGTEALAQEGYGTTGDVVPGDPADGAGSTPPANPLAGLLKGDVSGLIGLLTATKSGTTGGSTPIGSPLGVLSALISVSGMESVSSTTYDPDADSVVATATSRLGNVGLIAGLVQLTGVEVVTQTTSNIAGGAVNTSNVNIGGMSIAGQKFEFTGTGFKALGKTTPIPGLGDTAGSALKALGISFELGKAVATKDGPAGSITAEGLRITLDTSVLLTKIPLLSSLPISQLVAKIPALPGQAAILPGLLIALGQAHPRVDIVLGQSTTSAQTVAGISGGTSSGPDGQTTTGSGGTGGSGSGPSTAGGPLPNEHAPTSGNGQPVSPVVPNIVPVASGLPKLGGLPTWLALLGIAIALGIGWYVRRAGLLVFGNAITCTHGLKSGIPDLRKV
ncbi:MAG TPA: hypothetical protein VHZ06_04595 [Marmoricola sp.]|jgi:hypothetical protein|nr:hypothetical protein [Marmoricola sp.]